MGHPATQASEASKHPLSTKGSQTQGDGVPDSERRGPDPGRRGLKLREKRVPDSDNQGSQIQTTGSSRLRQKGGSRLREKGVPGSGNQGFRAQRKGGSRLRQKGVPDSGKRRFQTQRKGVPDSEKRPKSREQGSWTQREGVSEAGKREQNGGDPRPPASFHSAPHSETHVSVTTLSTWKKREMQWARAPLC